MTVIIGIDPHKATHTAVAIDGDEQPIARLCVTADRCQTDRLLAWAAPFNDRRWAIESAAGLGKLLAQQLLAAGEQVVDVPSTLSARVRLLGSAKAGKSDPNDALSTAIAGLRHCGLRAVQVEDHSAVLRLLVDRYDDLIALRTQAACRLHVALRELIAGGAPRRLNAQRAAGLLRTVRPDSAVVVERKRLAQDLLVDIRRHDRDITAIKERITDAVAASGTALTRAARCRPGRRRADTRPRRRPRPLRDPATVRRLQRHRTHRSVIRRPERHRLNPRGNRKLNHAMHLIAVTQIAHDTPGRVYYDRKLAEGKSRKEALRALKRRVSDAVWRQLRVDLEHA